MKHLLSVLMLGLGLGVSPLVHAQDADSDGVPNDVDAAPCDPAIGGMAFAPAEGVFGGLLFEDLWPARGDLDFNDVVLGHNIAVRQDPQGRALEIVATFDVMALGGIDDNGLGWHIPLEAAQVASVTRTVGGGAPEVLTPAADPELTVTVSDNLRELFGAAAGPINSLPSAPRVQGSLLSVTVTLAAPTAFGLGQAPFDVYIFKSGNPAHEIHLPGYSGTAAMDTALFGAADDGSTPSRRFVDFNGQPFALSFPNPVDYPSEQTLISDLYPRIIYFADSAGATDDDFYTSPVSAAAYRDVAGQPAPRGAVASQMVGDFSCLGVAVISGNTVGWEGSGNDLLQISQTGEVYALFGTAAGAAPLQSLYDAIDSFAVIIVPGFQGRDSNIYSTMSVAANRAKLEDWVRRGGVLYLAVYNDGGGQAAVFAPPGFGMSGADDRSYQTVYVDLPLFHSPNEILEPLRSTNSWERLSSYPSEATQTREILSSSDLVDFRMGAGYVMVNGIPMDTRYGSPWYGMHELYGNGVQFYQNLFPYLRIQVGQ